MAIAQLDDVHRVFQKGRQSVRAVDGVTLAVEEGEFVAIMGPSGSGKSTLLHLIGALDTPTSGLVEIDGQDLRTLSDLELSRLRNRIAGFVFQRYNLIPDLTAQANVELPMRYARKSKTETAARAARLLEMVGLSSRAQHYPAELSGGEEQRVAIARALANKPRLLLADEPTGNVDSSTKDQLMTMLRQLNKDGMTILLVTHDRSVAAYAQRVVCLEDGHIVNEQV